MECKHCPYNGYHYDTRCKLVVLSIQQKLDIFYFNTYSIHSILPIIRNFTDPGSFSPFFYFWNWKLGVLGWDCLLKHYLEIIIIPLVCSLAYFILLFFKRVRKSNKKHVQVVVLLIWLDTKKIPGKSIFELSLISIIFYSFLCLLILITRLSLCFSAHTRTREGESWCSWEVLALRVLVKLWTMIWKNPSGSQVIVVEKLPDLLRNGYEYILRDRTGLFE